MDSFSLLGCDECVQVKVNRTIVLTQPISGSGNYSIYSSLSNGLGNVEYEVRVLSPPDYLCYGSIKKELRFIVGLNDAEKAAAAGMNINTDVLNNSISVCSDRKTFTAGDAEVLQTNTQVLNWQKTY